MASTYIKRHKYSQACIKKSSLGQRKDGLKRGPIQKNIFFDRKRKGWHFNAGDYLREVTALAGLTV